MTHLRGRRTLIRLGAVRRHSTYTEQDDYGGIPGWCHTLRVDTIIILYICHKYHVKHTPKQRKLYRLKSESKSATNETPTCEVTLYAPQTNALCQWWGVRELSSAGEVGCWRRWQPGSLCRLVKGWDQRVRCCLKWALYAPKQTHALHTLHKEPKTHIFAKKKSVVGCGYVGGGSKVLSGIGC